MQEYFRREAGSYANPGDRVTQFEEYVNDSARGDRIMATEETLNGRGMRRVRRSIGGGKV